MRFVDVAVLFRRLLRRTLACCGRSSRRGKRTLCWWQQPAGRRAFFSCALQVFLCFQQVWCRCWTNRSAVSSRTLRCGPRRSWTSNRRAWTFLKESFLKVQGGILINATIAVDLSQQDELANATSIDSRMPCWETLECGKPLTMFHYNRSTSSSRKRDSIVAVQYLMVVEANVATLGDAAVVLPAVLPAASTCMCVFCVFMLFFSFLCSSCRANVGRHRDRSFWNACFIFVGS